MIYSECIGYQPNITIMSSNSLFVFAYNIPVPPSSISECLYEWTNCKVSRVDYVFSGYSSYYFVHFEQMIPREIIDKLRIKKESIRSRHCDIQVGLDKSNGIDPKTTDTIIQFIMNAQGSYHRYFNKPNEIFIWDEEAGIWMQTSENPYEIRDVVMEDDFISFEAATTTCSSPRPVYGGPFTIQSVNEIFYSSDEESRSTRSESPPPRPSKKQKTKRYTMTPHELVLCRALFV